jgi:hypothetical protein
VPSAAPWIDQQQWIGSAIPDSQHWCYELGSRRGRLQAMPPWAYASSTNRAGSTKGVLGIADHFEKMPYDKALLSRVYLHTYQASGDVFLRRIIEETLDYVLCEMTDSSPAVVCHSSATVSRNSRIVEQRRQRLNPLLEGHSMVI